MRLRENKKRVREFKPKWYMDIRKDEFDVLDYKIKSGKHAGKYLRDIYVDEPGYFDYVCDVLDNGIFKEFRSAIKLTR